MTLTAKMHSVAEKMRFLEPTAQIRMKINPYYQRQNCRPMIQMWLYDDESIKLMFASSHSYSHERANDMLW